VGGSNLQQLPSDISGEKPSAGPYAFEVAYQTPLHAAIRRRDIVAVVSQMTDLKQQPIPVGFAEEPLVNPAIFNALSAKDSYNQTPIETAADMGFWEIVREIAQQQQSLPLLGCRDWCYEEVLSQAISSGQADTAMCLLELVPPPGGIIMNNGWSILDWAMEKNDLTVIRALSVRTRPLLDTIIRAAGQKRWRHIESFLQAVKEKGLFPPSQPKLDYSGLFMSIVAALAAKHGKKALFKRAIEEGATIRVLPGYKHHDILKDPVYYALDQAQRNSDFYYLEMILDYAGTLSQRSHSTAIRIAGISPFFFAPCDLLAPNSNSLCTTAESPY